MKKLVIIDHFLIDNKGHDEQYDFSIAREAIEHGIDAEVWCPKRKNPNQPSFVKQYLNTPFWRKRNWGSMIFSAIASVFEWRSLLKKSELDKDTIVFIQMVKLPVLLSFSLATFGIEIKSKVVMVLRRKMNNLLMKYLYRRKNTIFISDSEIISQELKAEEFVSPKVLPMPYLPPRQKYTYPKKNTIVGYFGEARFDKGFDLLPELVNMTIKNKKDISFVIQANIHKSTKEMQAAMEKIKEISKYNPGMIEILDRYLSYSEYVDYMGKCSIVLAPYRKKFYGKGTSGILAETIACGSWAVVPNGTWMAKQRQKYDKIIGFAEPTPKALLQAISFCLEKDKSLDSSKLNSQIDRWYEFHSPKKYIEILQTI